MRRTTTESANEGLDLNADRRGRQPFSKTDKGRERRSLRRAVRGTKGSL